MVERQERLELQLSTSVKQVTFLAIETKYNQKHEEIKKMNEVMEMMRQENFTLRAHSDNN